MNAECGMRNAECGMAADTDGYGTERGEIRKGSGRGNLKRGGRPAAKPTTSPALVVPPHICAPRTAKDSVEAATQHIKSHAYRSLFLLFLVQLLLSLGTVLPKTKEQNCCFSQPESFRSMPAGAPRRGARNRGENHRGTGGGAASGLFPLSP